jgi:hypothetical protein
VSVRNWGKDVVLLQVFADRMVVGEIAVVHQGLVHADEGMRAAGMPDAALGGIALVGDPSVGPEILEPVVLDDLLGIADDFQDHQLRPWDRTKAFCFAQGGVKRLVQLEGVLVDEFVFGLARVHVLQAVVG